MLKKRDRSIKKLKKYIYSKEKYVSI